MTDFLQDNENRFGQAKKDFQNMTDEKITQGPEPQPVQPITEAEVSMMDCNLMLAKVLIYLQDNTLKPCEKIALLDKVNSFGKDLQELRTKIGRGVDEQCEHCNGEGCEVTDVEPDPETGAMLGSVGHCSECNGTGKKL